MSENAATSQPKNKSTTPEKVWTRKVITNVIFLFLGFIFLLWFFVILITANGPEWLDISTSDTSAIGDTIGGITSPLIGILGSVLVYLSFKEQFEANRLQRKALKEESIIREEDKKAESIMSTFKYLRDELDEFSFTYFENNSVLTPKGSSAFILLGSKIRSGEIVLSSNDDPLLLYTRHIVDTLDYLTSRLEGSHQIVYDQLELFHLIYSFYSYKLAPTLIAITKKPPPDKGGYLLSSIKRTQKRLNDMDRYSMIDY